MSKFVDKLLLHDQLNNTGITENAVFPVEKGKENYRPRTLVDETLEYIDPTPNIYTLFVQFNEKFFWNVLLPVQVKWSPRMTSCAGICSFHPRNKECIIALSTPLLKLRPRKDLVETLLHEMIHAYLFLTNDNRDRDGHGPVFQSHMHRINKIAGTRITIYHTFHEEVKLYQQHWWRCSGTCQNKAPYFGMVRRAMNRAPSSNDFWWAEHQATCGGQFIKIKEPEKSEKKKKGGGGGESKKRKSKNGESKALEKNSNLDWWVKKPGPQENEIRNSPTPNFKKLGNSTNNVHGWGTGGPNSTISSNNKPNQLTKSNQPLVLNFSGTCGGSGSGRSNLIDKYPSSTNRDEETRRAVTCPNCQLNVQETIINDHLDECLSTSTTSNNDKKRKNEYDYSTTSIKISKKDNAKNSNAIECPLCSKSVELNDFNEHLDGCSNNHVGEINDQTLLPKNANTSSINLQDSPHVCLICDTLLEPNVTLDQHLEDCVSSVFNDDSSNEDEKCDDKMKKYPCPVCMTLVDESVMNGHLDSCLYNKSCIL